MVFQAGESGINKLGENKKLCWLDYKFNRESSGITKLIIEVDYEIPWLFSNTVKPKSTNTKNNFINLTQWKKYDSFKGDKTFSKSTYNYSFHFLTKNSNYCTG